MRCRGETKAGTRCKRNAPDGSEYCATHVAQAATYAEATVDQETKSAPDEAPSHDVPHAEWWDKAAEVAMVGAVIVAAVALGRAIRAS